MDFTDCTGRKVDEIEWHVPAYGDMVTRKVLPGETAYYVHEYHGDHAENWIVFEVKGYEVARYNTRNIFRISWSRAFKNGQPACESLASPQGKNEDKSLKSGESTVKDGGSLPPLHPVNKGSQ